MRPIDLDPEIVAVVFARSYWRDGTPYERLEKCQKSAKARSKKDAEYIDPELELEIAWTAKQIKKAELSRHLND